MRRYPTANGLALDIQRFLANEAVSARPPSKLYRLRKAVLRNKLLFTGIGIIAGLLVVSLIVVSAAFAKERRSRRVAEAASVKSREVTKFLEAMLNGVGPSVARGRDTAMLREILDETAERVGNAMTNQPEVEAELCNIIGSLYAEIGNAPKGEEISRRGLAIRREKFGADGLEVAESLNLLGMLLMVQHKLPEAERAHGEALAIRRRRLGDENAETATSVNALAEVYRDQRKLTDAETMAREALRIREKLFGNKHLETANALRNLCMIQGYRERWAEAEQTAREVAAIRRKLLGNDDPLVASALEDQAWALSALDKFAEAQKLDTEALVIRQKTLGDAHPEVTRNLNALGQLLKHQGDLEGSEGVLKATLAIQRNLMGDDSQATASTLCSLARTLHDRRKLSEAESAWREAMAIYCKRLPPDHPDRVHAERGLGEILEAEGKWSEAEQLWRQSLSFWRQRGGIEEKESMYTLRRLGVNLECVRKWPEAEAVFQEALAISQKKGNEDPEVLVDLDRVIRSLLAQGKLAAAQQHLDQVLTPSFVEKPASAGLLVLRVNVMGRQGRWRQAAADAARALEHQLTDHYRYHTLAGLLAIAGDRPAYEQVCKRLVTKFADATDPYVSERIAQDYLLLPNSGADLERMDKLADKAVTAGSGTDGLPYFQACKAMSLYRLGSFPEAIAWGNRAAKSSTGFAQAKALAVMAMGHWQLGQQNEARSALAKGDALAPRTDDLGESWVAWLTARVSLDEATTLIQNKNPNAP
jgi:tetratricopeptide (TPR) repeat protein